jgi:hypothetical protein
MRRVVFASALLIASSAAAQSPNPGPPGPYVIDVRGVTSGVPSSGALYPIPSSPTQPPSNEPSSTPTSTTTLIVPSRGFGGEAGAHVYPLGLGPARLGIGASVVYARATAPDTVLTMQMIVPQLSFNFGTSNGWSYLSAGAGPVRIRTTRTFNTRSINAGGGARWFLNNHMAIGFDIRMHKLAARGALPQTTLVSASVGLSLK